MQMVIENLLSPYGYTVTMCVHGMQCLEVLESRDYPPDLLLLDIMMPHISGYEVCAKLREKYTRIDLPIIMISAKVDTESVSKCIELGSNDFVHKPFHRQELLSRIKAQLELKSMFQVQMDHQLSSNMLRLMMPDDVVDRIMSGQTTIVDTYESATYVFAEVVVEDDGQKVDSNIISMINSMSAVFEEVCYHHDMIKLERSGSYTMMAVAHLNQHASCALRMAMDLVRQSSQMGDSKCFVRVGIHSGSSTAAVLGDRMSSYCFLGEAVSMAGMLVGLAFPRMIVVSANTRSMLKSHEEFEFSPLECNFMGGNGLLKQEVYCLVHEDVEWERGLEIDKIGGLNEKVGSYPAISEDQDSGRMTTLTTQKPGVGEDRYQQQKPGWNSDAGSDTRSSSFDLGGAIRRERGASPYRKGSMAGMGESARSMKNEKSKNLSAEEVDDAARCKELGEMVQMQSVKLRGQQQLLDSRESQLSDLSRRFDELKRSKDASDKSSDIPLQTYAVGAVNDDGLVAMDRSAYSCRGSTQMCDFLTRIRMRSKISRFEDFGLCSVADLVDLSEAEMSRVGVVNMGEQVRLRRSAKLWIQSVQAGLIEALPIE